MAAAVRALLPLTRPELKATEASALSSYLAAVTAVPTATATGGQATGGQAGQPRRLACLLGWSDSQAGGSKGVVGGSEQVVHLLQAALHSLKDEERRTLDWHFCSHPSNGRGTNSAPGTAAQPSAAVGQLALCGASELLQGCLDGAQLAGVTPHAAVAIGLAALCDILRKARAALDTIGEQRDDAGSPGGGCSTGGMGGGGGGGGVATPVVNLSCVSRVAAVACLRPAAARESIGFSVLRCAPQGVYVGVEVGMAAASGAAQRLLHSEPRQERGLRTRLQHAVYPAAADATAADASDSATAGGKGVQPAAPLIIMTDPGKDQDDELALILCRTMCDLDLLELQPSLHLLCHDTYSATIPTRCDLGLFELKAVVANLCPAGARAKLARGTLDSLAQEDVPVAVGSEARRSGIEDNFTASVSATGFDYLVREVEEVGEAEDGDSSFDNSEGKGGLKLLLKTYLAADDHSLTLLIIAAMTDAAAFIEQQPSLFAAKTRSVAIMGGVDPACLDPSAQMMMPDQSAANHVGDQPAAATVFRRCQELGVRLVVLTRAAAYGASVPAFIYDELATVSSEW